MRTLRYYTVDAIVLKRKNIGESDRLITLFTKQQGKIQILAKGIRRITSRRAPHVDVFSHCMVTIAKGKVWDSMTEATKVNHDIIFSESLPKLSFAYYLCELIDRLIPEREEHHDIFLLFQKALQDIASGISEQHWHETASAFALELLWSLGYLPRTEHLSTVKVRSYVEQLIERKLLTVKLLTTVGGMHYKEELW